MKPPTFFEEMSPVAEWNELARKICKRNEENKLTNQQVLDEIEDTDEEDYDDDEDDDVLTSNSESDETKEGTTKKKVEASTTTSTSTTTMKAPKEKSTIKPKLTSSEPPSIVDSNNENDESEADEDYDYSEEDKEDESIPDEPYRNVLLDGVKVIKDIDSRIFGEFLGRFLFGISFQQHLLLGGHNDDEAGETDEVIIEEATTSYRFIWPMLIVMLSIVIVLLVIMNIIALCMRKRGERYRQALLQSKNSIIYQKLSEEITPQTPKLHRYTPIQQV